MNISARIILAVIWGSFVVAALAAPLLLSASFPTASFFTYLPFSFFCHQAPERSFALMHHPIAVCHRCSGIYLGLFLGTLLSSFFFRLPMHARRACILLASSFLILDAIIPFTGLWSGFWLCRFLTGLVFGLAAAPFAVMGLDEIIKTLSRRGREVSRPLKGVLS